MLALSSGGHIKSLPEKVESLGEHRIIFMTPMIKRTNLDRVVGHEYELMTVLFPNVLSQSSLVRRIEILLVGDHMVSLGKDSPSFGQTDARKRKVGNDDIDAESLFDFRSMHFGNPTEGVMQQGLLKVHDILIGFNP